MPFKAPFIKPEKIREKADEFREYYWGKDVPVDVLSVAEFDLDLEIRPVNDLKDRADIDALLSSNFKILFVDKMQLIDDRYENRLRFSIAHELGHYVLHRKVFKEFKIANIADYINLRDSLPNNEYGWLEYHANEFAGRLLVPHVRLKKEFDEVKGTLPSTTSDDLVQEFVATQIAGKFGVCKQTLEIRLTKEGLI